MDLSDGKEVGAEEEEEEESVLATQFPPVPAYYKSYGPPEIGEDGQSVERKLHPTALSLKPPKIPEGMYRCFGEVWVPDEKPKTLREEGREQLFEYPEDGTSLNVGKEVKKICLMMIEKYREFLGGLGDMDEPPKVIKERAEEFETIYINLLYLINQLRPAQGRQTLIELLKKQIEQRIETTKMLNDMVVNGESSIQAAVDQCQSSSADLVQSQSMEIDGKPSAIDNAIAGQTSINIFDIAQGCKQSAANN